MSQPGSPKAPKAPSAPSTPGSGGETSLIAEHGGSIGSQEPQEQKAVMPAHQEPITTADEGIKSPSTVADGGSDGSSLQVASPSLALPPRPDAKQLGASPRYNIIGETLYGVPEEDTVREFGFRAGQMNRGTGGDKQIPANNFTKQLDHLWTESYELGKLSNGNAATKLEIVRKNYDWAPLINVYTQTPENPKGTFDLEYARKTIESALDTMKITTNWVCNHPKEWQKIVIDVPAPIAIACQEFPDLAERYAELKQAAFLAKNYQPYRNAKGYINKQLRSMARR
ncbi:hypothetical protein BU24DRAFT_450496 [Aaosphaeria arxii CBS 175.79]|uniref:Uncharacterized protein n=1 Tax=Aaosphaeria arxii CBS 175.79 TaxID=1450172 RepID=A0A6A5XRQ1_9PLEO|nr:uncharacterized protein BU24DRAFT_450496 [Aaosphaeria arxii CBS 175.79]KAF2015852.1 hypothetical protein BU24DRAFT_450496 [Aaosphaeria arxii CBS 175.79]